MEPLTLNEYEKRMFISSVEANVNIHEAAKKDNTQSTKVLADRILDDLNNILKSRGKQGADTPRRHPEDVGDPVGFVTVKADY